MGFGSEVYGTIVAYGDAILEANCLFAFFLECLYIITNM